MRQSIPRMLSDRVNRAIRAAIGTDVPPGGQGAGGGLTVNSCNEPRFGDYQFNGALALAKAGRDNPRSLAARVVAALDVSDICEPPEIAGPGFVNFRLSKQFMVRTLEAVQPPDPTAEIDRLGIESTNLPEKVVVDMSSPNLAKEMHVGHLRSTVIGESVARILEFDGHDVERVNHVGDWGTPCGMLVARLRSVRPDVLADPEHLAINDLESFYVDAKRQFDQDPAFADTARKTVVALQSGDRETLKIWEAFCRESLRHCHDVYEQLGVRQLIDRGESFYNDQLPDVLQELTSLGLVVESDGADCIFLEGFKARDGSLQPMMIRKSDGGYNYSATDLAAVRHRVRDLGATRLVYVVGAPQKRHFEMLFAAVRKAGWADGHVRLEHLAFGSMLGPDGKPFKTREGGTVKLRSLLEEAVARARRVVEGNVSADTAPHDLTEAQIDRIAETVGIGAVKYYDLSHGLGTDYRFDWDLILALEGNTAPYLLYAYARIRSIGRKAGVDFAALPAEARIVLEHETELALARGLLRYAEVIEQIVSELRPNVLTEYLYDLSKRFSRFYDRKQGVRVVDAAPIELRLSRLRLCDVTARVLKSGLHLLGIETLEQM